MWYDRDMFTHLDTRRLIAFLLIILALIVLSFQNNPPFFFLFPILLFLLGVSWFLYREIQKENEESYQQGIRYMQKEAEAQRWLKKSFMPKVRKLVERELQILIFASALILVSFIFLWSFFVAGFTAAVINTGIGILFFVGFLIYTLYAPKEFTHLFKHVPLRYRHHSKNDWVHGYLLLFPFAMVGYFLYAAINGEGFIESLFATVIFLLSYTLLFVCVYCIWYLYREYQKDLEHEVKKAAKELIRKEKH